MARKTHTISEDEYIGEVNGSVLFATTSYPINPGQATTFPWGSRIASLYEKYHFTRLEFYYRREVSEFATNGQAGKVMLSVDFDASDNPPATKQQVLDTEPHIDGMPCVESIILRVDCRQMAHQDGCYVRPGAQPANTDIKTYDAGNLFVSTYGNTNNSAIGELRVRYTVVVSVPVLESTVTLGAPGSYLWIASPFAGEAPAATTVYQPLFASATNPILIGNGIGATIASTGLITLPAGVYTIEANLSCVNVGSTDTVGGFIALCTSASADTGVVFTATATVQSLVNGVLSGGKWGNGELSQIVWNTAQMGTTVCIQSALAYSAGAPIINGVLKVTLL
jgi:hypothetical protein